MKAAFTFPLSALVAIALTGCASSPQDMRSAHKATTLSVAQPYQRVYRTLITNARTCWQSGMITAQMVVDGDLYTDTRSAQISGGVSGAVGLMTTFAIDVKALDDANTRIDIYSRNNESYAKRIESWLLGSTEC